MRKWKEEAPPSRKSLLHPTCTQHVSQFPYSPSSSTASLELCTRPFLLFQRATRTAAGVEGEKRRTFSRRLHFRVTSNPFFSPTISSPRNKCGIQKNRSLSRKKKKVWDELEAEEESDCNWVFLVRISCCSELENLRKGEEGRKGKLVALPPFRHTSPPHFVGDGRGWKVVVVGNWIGHWKGRRRVVYDPSKSPAVRQMASLSCSTD